MLNKPDAGPISNSSDSSNSRTLGLSLFYIILTSECDPVFIEFEGLMGLSAGPTASPGETYTAGLTVSS